MLDGFNVRVDKEGISDATVEKFRLHDELFPNGFRQINFARARNSSMDRSHCDIRTTCLQCFFFVRTLRISMKGIKNWPKMVVLREYTKRFDDSQKISRPEQTLEKTRELT